MRVRVSISGKIGHECPHPQQVPFHMRLTQLGEITKIDDHNLVIKLGELHNDQYMLVIELTPWEIWAHWLTSDSKSLFLH
jgi:hypothetical protein